MTDDNPSGASNAPAADFSASAASAGLPAVNFGGTRGSGLARGKRQSSASAPATSSPVKTDYKPTALEVIVPQREYQNPFASPEPASAPVAEPAEENIPAAPVARIEPEPEVAPEIPVSPQAAAERPEIQILPPAESVRPAVSWESPSASQTHRETASEDQPRLEDRPTFRPDRREDRNGGGQPESERPRFEAREPRRDSFQRQPRDPREARQPRDPREARQPRDPRDQPRDPRDQPRDPRDQRPHNPQRDSGVRTPEAAPAASGGFMAWLKGLFGAKQPAETAVAARPSAEPSFGEGQRPRRRHRGGRGHGGDRQGGQGGNPQGFRGERTEASGDRPFGGGEREGQGGERQGGPRRRRHRGGSGRGRGGEFRSEGKQGGGAI
jgi:hypothetical protein